MVETRWNVLGARLAPVFGQTAATFARKATEVETNRDVLPASERYLTHNAYVFGSVIASATFLETTVNEVLVELAERYEPFRSLRELNIPRTAAYATLLKYQMCLILTNAEPFAVNRSPYQDAAAVVSVRNELVHFEPGIQRLDRDYGNSSDLPPLHKLVGRLRGKFPLNRLTAQDAPMWPYKLLGAGCATWAITKSVEFVEAFADQLPVRSVARATRKHTKDIRRILNAQ